MKINSEDWIVETLMPRSQFFEIMMVVSLRMLTIEYNLHRLQWYGKYNGIISTEMQIKSYTPWRRCNHSKGEVWDKSEWTVTRYWLTVMLPGVLGIHQHHNRAALSSSGPKNYIIHWKHYNWWTILQSAQVWADIKRH